MVLSSTNLVPKALCNSFIENAYLVDTHRSGICLHKSEALHDMIQQVLTPGYRPSRLELSVARDFFSDNFSLLLLSNCILNTDTPL